MPRNVEVKARIHEIEKQCRRLALLSKGAPQVIVQEDIFFNAPQGRLKLRVLAPTRGELIYYQRPDHAGPKTSTYAVVETDRPVQLKAVLEAAYGVRNAVRKTRRLYMIGRTRVHIDQVESVGNFLELEVVLGETEDPVVGEREAHQLMQQLGIQPEQLVEGAYIDLLEGNG